MVSSVKCKERMLRTGFPWPRIKSEDMVREKIRKTVFKVRENSGITLLVREI